VLLSGAAAAAEQWWRSSAERPLRGSCGQPGGGAPCGASGEGRGRPNLQWRRGGGDGAGPHVGAVVLPAERRGGRTTAWSVALTHFLGVEIDITMHLGIHYM
jgi:hypothetical protein